MILWNARHKCLCAHCWQFYVVLVGSKWVCCSHSSIHIQCTQEPFPQQSVFDTLMSRTVGYNDVTVR